MRKIGAVLLALALSALYPVYGAEECRGSSVEQVLKEAKDASVNVVEFRGTLLTAILKEIETIPAPQGMKEEADAMFILRERGQYGLVFLAKGPCMLGVARMPREMLEVIINTILREVERGSASQPKL